MSALAAPRRPKPISPARAVRLRERMAEAVERLIEAIDALDGENEHGGDVLDEPHDDDPAEVSLGWPETMDQSAITACDNSDRELDPTDDVNTWPAIYPQREGMRAAGRTAAAELRAIVQRKGVKARPTDLRPVL